ncbi:MAG: TetR/AcrR family transcriptional regulator [Candidatus Nanopelagicales bacterium]
MPECRIRRRGEVLREAVYAATLAEVAEHGLRGASMDRIAHRAGTGKAALYRRWPNVRALALDVFITTMEQALPAERPDTGSLRGDILASLDTLAEELGSDLGIVLRELISEAAHDPSLSQEFQRRFGAAKEAEVVLMLEQAMHRGDIPRQALDPYVLQLPAALIVHQLVLTGAPPTRGQLEHIVDAIMLPLLRQPSGLPIPA